MRGTGEYPTEAERAGHRPGRKTIGRRSVTQRTIVTVTPAVRLAACGGAAGMICAGTDLAKRMAPQYRRRLIENAAVAGLSVGGGTPAVRHVCGTDGAGMVTTGRELPVGHAHIGHWIGPGIGIVTRGTVAQLPGRVEAPAVELATCRETAGVAVPTVSASDFDLLPGEAPTNQSWRPTIGVRAIAELAVAVGSPAVSVGVTRNRAGMRGPRTQRNCRLLETAVGRFLLFSEAFPSWPSELYPQQ
jgi:hypothetical protein